MQPANTVSQKLVDFIRRSFLDSCNDLTPETPLLELNILDSASLFDVVDFVRTQWQISIPSNEIHPGNFGSIEKLDALITRLLPRGATS